MSDLKYYQRENHKQAGTALIMVVFVVALLSAVVMGILQLNVVEIQIMQNHVNAVEARMVAQAGLNDAVSRLRLDSEWDDGFEDRAFNGGTHTVTVSNQDEIEATRTSAQGFTCVVTAAFTATSTNPPHTIRMGALRINE